MHYSKLLATFAASLKPSAIPEAVLRRGEDLLVDWFGSAVAGKGAAPVEAITQFAMQMGPHSGAAELLINRSSSSPYLAAMS
ncbi:MAG: MmgE/PrpD family protein, partial [Polynucleobacter sp.]|nr:MmgE/PrpD family protein [Polynucleobacter sp.]